MLGSIGYVSLACMGWWAYELEDEYWLLDKVSTGIFVVDSFLYVMAWLRLKLIAGNGPDQVFMFDFTQHWRYNCVFCGIVYCLSLMLVCSVFLCRRIDYSGWGDWLFVVGSGLYFVDSYVCHFFDDPDELLVCEKINFAAAILFVVGTNYVCDFFHFVSLDQSFLISLSLLILFRFLLLFFVSQMLSCIGLH